MKTIMNQKLNPKLFNEADDLRDEVRNAILEIVEEFISQIEVPNDQKFPLYDIILVGSNAGYNYTPASDLDIHLVTSYEEVSRCCPDCVALLFDADRRLFNSSYDLSIYGISAEVYVEDVNANTMSNGIYSVMTQEWVKYPEKTPTVVLDQKDSDYLSALEKAEFLLTDDTVTSLEVEEFINSLYLLRKYSLSTEGEFGAGNLIFKKLRSDGVLDKLKIRRDQLLSNELSLSSPFYDDNYNG